MLSTINVGGIGENANGHARARDVGQSAVKKISSERIVGRGRLLLYGARETFVSLGVIVLKTDLEFDCLHKVAFFLVVSSSKKFLDGAPHA